MTDSRFIPAYRRAAGSRAKLGLDVGCCYHFDSGMKSVHIKDVPEETIERLKRLARAHHRSLQGELRHILQQSAELAEPGRLPPIRLNHANTGRRERWSREEIYGDEAR